ncbi:Uncharacterised protein [uncultured Blautia sp.]|nr:hypothetical protein [uncultured Blautia sp.]VEJ94993.1 Uncharacterised protein [uncultured Blautia sp.]
MKLAYQRKTRDRWDIETNYGYGWEAENSEYNRVDAKRSLREYKENLEAYGKCAVRMVKRRERVEESA